MNVSKQTIVGIILIAVGIAIGLYGIGNLYQDSSICLTAGVVGIILFGVGLRIVGIRIGKWARK